MKIIVFTMKSGLKLTFQELTRMRNPKTHDNGRLSFLAKTAMEVDDHIQSFEIEDRKGGVA